MTKKGNLSAALNRFDNRSAVRKEEPALAPPISATQAPAAPHAEAAPVAQGRAALPPSRQGKKALTGYFDPEVLRQLKVMAAADDTTIQALMSEALNDLFKKYGKPHIA
jgi:hypothetical protein